jgi:tRNA threonylcarbamoyladenosine biosynthesis protein TsaE
LKRRLKLSKVNKNTYNQKETQLLGEEFAGKLKGGEIICLEGDLGAGKTTFTQGLLRGLEAEGPYTSPTFLIMKEYALLKPQSIRKVYHIDAYRIGAEDLLQLGWEEIVTDKQSVVIIEWPEKVAEILPKEAMKIKLEWVDENERKIYFK